MTVKKNRGIEKLKSRYGLMFVLPWLVGIVLFMILPIIQSVIYSFSNVYVTDIGTQTEFVGLAHYDYLINRDPQYLDMLKAAVSSITYRLPLIIILSLIIALLLNQKFIGRTFFRAIYFLPVIIATGAVMNLIFTTTTSSDITSGTSTVTSVVSVDTIMNFLDLPSSLAKDVTKITNDIFNIVWSCGIQIVLYISGLQTIPASIYEACHVEGATKWEQFWFITFPMLGRVTLLVIVFTAVELFTDSQLKLIENISTRMTGGKYDETSAMLWFYFIIVIAIIGLILLVYNKALLKKWE